MKPPRRRHVLSVAALVLGSIAWSACHKSSPAREVERRALGPVAVVPDTGAGTKSGWAFGPVTVVPGEPPQATADPFRAVTPLREESVAARPAPTAQSPSPPVSDRLTPLPDASPSPSAPPPAAADQPSQSAAQSPAGVAGTSPLQDVFFEFDDATIREDQRPALDAAAEWLKANPTARITIEGYCDERGTSEYNLALGERRASAAKAYLVVRGVPLERIQTMSYGEERPFVLGHDETVWKWNRRAHLVVTPSR